MSEENCFARKKQSEILMQAVINAIRKRKSKIKKECSEIKCERATITPFLALSIENKVITLNNMEDEPIAPVSKR